MIINNVSNIFIDVGRCEASGAGACLVNINIFQVDDSLSVNNFNVNSYRNFKKDS